MGGIVGGGVIGEAMSAPGIRGKAIWQVLGRWAAVTHTGDRMCHFGTLRVACITTTQAVSSERVHKPRARLLGGQNKGAHRGPLSGFVH